jgi:hypothetical protein
MKKFWKDLLFNSPIICQCVLLCSLGLGILSYKYWLGSLIVFIAYMIGYAKGLEDSK